MYSSPTKANSKAVRQLRFIYHPGAFLVTQLVKTLPAMQETPVSIPGSVRSLGEGIGYPLQHSWASLVAQTVKNLPAMHETQVRSPGWEGPLEKEIDTPVFLPGGFHGERRLVGYNP